LPSALLQFTQGITVGLDGQALIVLAATPVVAANSDDSTVKIWTYTLKGRPLGSALTKGVKSLGAVPTFTFTPDVAGMYAIELIVQDANGLIDKDLRCVGVLNANGRLPPSFQVTGDSCNFGGQDDGWQTYVNPYFDAVDGGGGAGGTVAMQMGFLIP
jgi:hypothetical protein